MAGDRTIAGVTVIVIVVAVAVAIAGAETRQRRWCTHANARRTDGRPDRRTDVQKAKDTYAALCRIFV